MSESEPVGEKGLCTTGRPLALTELVASTLSSMSHNFVGQREVRRVDSAVSSATEMIRVRVAEGAAPRSDGFLVIDQNGESEAGEILEGVLLAAKRDHEEKKAKHLGYLFANTSFEEEIDKQLANWCISLTENLTWVQLVLIELIARPADITRTPESDIHKGITSWRSWSIRDQLMDLGYTKRNIVIGEQTQTERMGFTLTDTTFRGQKLANGGIILRSLLQLDRIEQAEIDEVLLALLWEG